MRPPRPPLDQARARNCAFINQLGTPGLGSLMAGRVLTGIGQLLLAVAGFVMVTVWFVRLCLGLYHQAFSGGDPHPILFPWLGQAGGLAFLAAWLWSLFTSFQLVREARLRHEREAGKTPPLLPRSG